MSEADSRRTPAAGRHSGAVGTAFGLRTSTQIADLALLAYSERAVILRAANRRKGTTCNRGQINDRTL